MHNSYNISSPTLQIFLPSKKVVNNTAVIICPGGGYGNLSMDFEGIKTAKMLNKWGIVAFVLKYRLPSDVTMKNKSIGPLQDLQQAIKFIKGNAKKWDIDPSKIGVIGFSAGGHLAAGSGVHFDHPIISGTKKGNIRPDFMVLVYPLITMKDSATHLGSRNNLLGEKPSQEIVNFFSNELHVTCETPPVLLFHAQDDKLVGTSNTIMFYKALTKNNVPVEMHIFSTGDHGFLNNDKLKDEWPMMLKNWRVRNGWISRNRVSATIKSKK